MALLYNFYKEVEQETIVHSYQKGIAAFTSDSSFSIPPGQTGSGWISLGGSSDMEYMYWAQVGANPQGITITGAPLYDFILPQTRPYNALLSPDNYFTSDKVSENGATIYTAGFTADLGIQSDKRAGFCFRFSYEESYYGSTDRYLFYPERLYYTQTPTTGERTAWHYYDSNQTTFAKAFPVPIYKTDAAAGKGKVIIVSTTIGETEYIMIACSVDAAGKVNENTYLILLPRISVDNVAGIPYVGPVSEESVAASFVPVIEKHDEIKSRTSFDMNPYGVNTGSGIKLIFPNVLQDHSVYTGNMQQIINGIYRGSATGLINMATQYIAEMTGGNSARPQNEIQVILNGIFSAHSIPIIFPPGSGGYETNATQFKSICGYDILLNQIDVTSPGQKTIFEYTYTSETIEQRLNCFLDFEPYTDITLKLPFFPAMSLQPSMIYGNRLKITYKIDILTGVLSADVAIIYFGKEVIISTIQQNVKTSIPIMGAGATDGALNKIATSAISLISSFGSVTHGSGEDATTGLSFNAGAAAGAILTGADAISRAGTAVPVGRKSVDGLGVYLSPRTAYLIISHPEAAIPAAHEDGKLIGSFLDTFGMAASLGGKVGDFAGGYASFSSVDLSGFEATEAEKDAIRSALFEGVIV